ncbi:unnamed protein product [Amoebophrya sp. A25]|nr:unnamed protein product [Amoebophrya sp. A25]|eukprot:GSA25T00001098001.1
MICSSISMFFVSSVDRRQSRQPSALKAVLGAALLICGVASVAVVPNNNTTTLAPGAVEDDTTESDWMRTSMILKNDDAYDQQGDAVRSKTSSPSNGDGTTSTDPVRQQEELNAGSQELGRPISSGTSGSVTVSVSEAVGSCSGQSRGPRRTDASASTTRALGETPKQATAEQVLDSAVDTTFTNAPNAENTPRKDIGADEDLTLDEEPDEDDFVIVNQDGTTSPPETPNRPTTDIDKEHEAHPPLAAVVGYGPADKEAPTALSSSLRREGGLLTGRADDDAVLDSVAGEAVESVDGSGIDSETGSQKSACVDAIDADATIAGDVPSTTGACGSPHLKQVHEENCRGHIPMDCSASVASTDAASAPPTPAAAVPVMSPRAKMIEQEMEAQAFHALASEGPRRRRGGTSELSEPAQPPCMKSPRRHSPANDCVPAAQSPPFLSSTPHCSVASSRTLLNNSQTRGQSSPPSYSGPSTKDAFLSSANTNTNFSRSPLAATTALRGGYLASPSSPICMGRLMPPATTTASPLANGTPICSIHTVSRTSSRSTLQEQGIMYNVRFPQAVVEPPRPDVGAALLASATCSRFFGSSSRDQTLADEEDDIEMGLSASPSVDGGSVTDSRILRLLDTTNQKMRAGPSMSSSTSATSSTSSLLLGVDGTSSSASSSLGSSDECGRRSGNFLHAMCSCTKALLLWPPSSTSPYSGGGPCSAPPPIPAPAHRYSNAAPASPNVQPTWNKYE